MKNKVLVAICTILMIQACQTTPEKKAEPTPIGVVGTWVLDTAIHVTATDTAGVADAASLIIGEESNIAERIGNTMSEETTLEVKDSLLVFNNKTYVVTLLDAYNMVLRSGTDEDYVVSLYQHERDFFLPECDSTEEVFGIVDEAAKPEGEYMKFYSVIAEELAYPEYSRINNIAGKVFVQFVVRPDSSICNIQAIKGISPECNRAAEDAVYATAQRLKFIPGKKDGKVVNQKLVMPITFKLIARDQSPVQ